MKFIYAFSGVMILIGVAYGGINILGLYSLFGVILPCAAFTLFIIGTIYRILEWARLPVPFHIPAVCGQQKGLSWIKADNCESPYTTFGVVKRMVLEVLFFRSLFRNDRTELREQGRLVYGANRFLWLGGMIFHWSLLIILLRHLRFFLEPVPAVIVFLQKADGMFDVAVPAIIITDILILTALIYLVVRRLISPQVRYISLISDYFPLLLIMAIVISGALMRHVFNADLFAVKKLVTGLAHFQTILPQEAGIVFYIHLFLVCILFVYIPFSKLTHMAGVFFSPTRNLMNNSRAVRHINPWNHPVPVHTYEEYEDEFRDALKEAGLPLEKEEK